LASAQENDTLFFYELGIEDMFETERELVQIGTRTSGHEILESAVPIDIITAEQLASSPQIELSQVLTYLIPSFNANNQTISDGTDHIVPSSLRGLGPDQILVFINGKRRHTSALVNVNGTFGRGSVSTDFDAIPIAAIERIEVLRDGASAQYGSDAIAGVINIVLKSNYELDLTFTIGHTIKGDGLKQKYDVNYGLKIGENGFCNITGELVVRRQTNRSGNYTGAVYHSDSLLDEDAIRTANFDRQTMVIGNAQAKTGKLFYNLSLPFRQAEFYSFGGLTHRLGMASGFYRFPKEEEKVVLELFPNGFLPELHTPIQDKSFCVGLKQKYSNWNIDLSANYGKNTFDFELKESNNASLGVASPVEFYCGGFEFSQLTSNFDMSRVFNPKKGIKKINFAFGSEFRLDNYSISPGEEASYIKGNSLTSTGEERYPGAQLFSGFQPQNQLDKNRFSTSIYLDFEMDVNDKLFVELASNFVDYSDWGYNLSGKIATRYKITPHFFARGAISTGFRSSSLHQSYLTNISTQIIDGTSFLVGTFNNKSSVTKELDIPSLTEENSINYSLGVILKPINNLNITCDLYMVSIYNRIVLSGRFSGSQDSSIAKTLNPFGINSAQFFTNAVDTKTIGGDIIANYKYSMGEAKNLYLTFAYNRTETKILGDIKASGKLEGKEEILFNREERSRIEVAQPNHKIILSGKYKFKRFGLLGRTIRFGQIKYIHPQNPYQDQTFTPKWITDLTIDYRISKLLTIELGGNNIFNVYPDKLNHEANTSSGQFIYSRRVTQFGFSGAYYFFRFYFDF
jgi:iron complex outermembrane receptor protein